MDSLQQPEVNETMPKKKNFFSATLRFLQSLLLFVIFFISLLLAAAIILVYFASVPIVNPLSMPSHCKIVSTGVDIRSSKVCEPGFLNYNYKDICTSERSKIRCRYDYYWASVFKVEYKDQFSGTTKVAISEAPDEALPLYCRPNFGAAWLTQYKFKINETYDCWHTSGVTKVKLYNNDLFSCQADKPPTMELIRKYSTQSFEVIESWLSRIKRNKQWKWETISGVVMGFLTSFISIGILRLLESFLSFVFHIFANWLWGTAAIVVRIKRTLFLVAQFSFAAWLVVQYGKRFGIMEIFGRS